MQPPTVLQSQTAADASSHLVALGKAGDAPAIDELVRRYWRDAYGVALRILRCHEDAEEVAQDALQTAITHLCAFRQDAYFYTWLRRIVINQSLMLLRQKRSPLRSPVSTWEVNERYLSDRSPSPEQVLLEAERQSLVDRGLTRVPPLYAIALRLFALEGRSVDEVANQLGISHGAAKTRIFRARVRLQRETSRVRREREAA
jgi:RNA polymerase sigma-70 factor, ECF subfamily